MGTFVDLHAHFLPALDDGAKTPQASMQMIAAMEALGFSWINTTPHQRAGMYLPERGAIDQAFVTLKAEVNAAFPQLKMAVAAENYWDDVFLGRLQDGSLPCYESERAFLFELNPELMPPRLSDRLFEIRLNRRLPVMAHPERYLAVQKDVARAAELGRSAALVVDLGALEGAHGRPAMKAARRLLEEDLAHAVATDIHSPDDQRGIAAGMAWIRKRLGSEMLDRLLSENPRRILAGELP